MQEAQDLLFPPPLSPSPQTSKESWREGICHLDTMRPSARGRRGAGLEPGPWSEWLSPRDCQQPISIPVRLGQGRGGGPTTPISEAQLTAFAGRDQNAQDTGALSS